MQTENTQPDATECKIKKKRYDRRLTISAVCLAFVFFLSFSPYTTPHNLIWQEIKTWGLVAVPLVLSSFAFIHLLPVLVRGSATQRVSAVILLIVAGYYSAQGWEEIIFHYMI